MYGLIDDIQELRTECEQLKRELADARQAIRKVVIAYEGVIVCGDPAHRTLRNPLCRRCQLGTRIEEVTQLKYAQDDVTMAAPRDVTEIDAINADLEEQRRVNQELVDNQLSEDFAKLERDNFTLRK